MRLLPQQAAPTRTKTECGTRRGSYRKPISADRSARRSDERPRPVVSRREMAPLRCSHRTSTATGGGSWRWPASATGAPSNSAIPLPALPVEERSPALCAATGRMAKRGGAPAGLRAMDSAGLRERSGAASGRTQAQPARRAGELDVDHPEPFSSPSGGPELPEVGGPPQNPRDFSGPASAERGTAGHPPQPWRNQTPTGGTSGQDHQKGGEAAGRAHGDEAGAGDRGADRQQPPLAPALARRPAGI